MPPTNNLWHKRQQHTNPDTKTYIYQAETTPHLATILSFPSHVSTFPSLHTKTCTEIINLATTIALFEPVRLHVRPEDQSRAQDLLNQALETASAPDIQRERISLIPAPTNHVWVRDTGPVYVRGVEDGKRYAIDFGFCEWGNKLGELIYNDSEDKTGAFGHLASGSVSGPPSGSVSGTTIASASDWPIMDAKIRAENTAFASRVLEIENAANPSNPVTRVVSAVRLEGGGIEMDGEGTFLAAESSVLVPSRNAGLSRDEVETELRRLLGVEKFIWVPGREGLDITDCHIDAEARFIRPGVVVLCKPHPSCEQVYFDIYNEIRSILERETDAQGRKFEIHDIVEPDPKLVKGETPVPGEEACPAASYVNFYFVNGGLVVPAFGDEGADREALEVLRGLVPGRSVVQVAVNALPRTGGVLHCTTQQVV